MQQGRQRKLSVKILSSLPPNFQACVLSGETLRHALPCYNGEEMKILTNSNSFPEWELNPQPVYARSYVYTHLCHCAKTASNSLFVFKFHYIGQNFRLSKYKNILVNMEGSHFIIFYPFDIFYCQFEVKFRNFLRLRSYNTQSRIK